MRNKSKIPLDVAETERLRIIPLTYGQLQKYVKTDHSLERELGLNDTERSISKDLKEALEQTILPNVADPDKDYLFCTLWTIILKAENRMVGDLCFIGEPNEYGEVEIGYGTYDEFQGKGYMTEAVGGMVKWAEAHPGVISIIAGTEKANAASFRVLEKNGFKKFKETDQFYVWRLDLQTPKPEMMTRWEHV